MHSLISIPREIGCASPMTFIFSATNHNGLFNFFEKYSFRTRNDVVIIENVDTKKNSSVQNLLFWNNDSWDAETECKYVSFVIYFKFPWMFKIFGYRLRSGNDHFFQNWTLLGINSGHRTKGDDKKVVLSSQKNNFVLSSNYAEKSFEIQHQDFFNGFQVNLKNNMTQ
jgi:hypothetical protein